MPEPATTSGSDARIRHWPALARFYGLSIHELHTTPRAVLRVFEEQMPVIQAREQLAANVAQDWPHLKEGARGRFHKDLLEQAGWAQAPVARPRADARKLAAIGIKVVFEEPKEEAA